MLIASGPAALLGGIVSDRMDGRRKVLVIGAAILMGAVSLFCAFFVRTLLLASVAMFFFGIGYGCFLVFASSVCLSLHCYIFIGYIHVD